MPRKRGPKRIEPQLLKLRGSRLKNRPTAAKGVGYPPRCPSWLDAEAKAEWRRVVRELSADGLLRPGFQSGLAGLCQSWSLFVRMSTKADQMMLARDLDVMDLRCVAAIASDCLKNYTRLAGCFGVTPADHQKLDTPNAAQVPDRMDSFLQKRHG